MHSAFRVSKSVSVGIGIVRHSQDLKSFWAIDSISTEYDIAYEWEQNFITFDFGLTILPSPRLGMSAFVQGVGGMHTYNPIDYYPEETEKAKSKEPIIAGIGIRAEGRRLPLSLTWTTRISVEDGIWEAWPGDSLSSVMNNEIIQSSVIADFALTETLFFRFGLEYNKNIWDLTWPEIPAWSEDFDTRIHESSTFIIGLKVRLGGIILSYDYAYNLVNAYDIFGYSDSYFEGDNSWDISIPTHSISLFYMK